MDFLTREARLSRPVRIFGLIALALALSTLTWAPVMMQYPLTQSGDGQYFHRLMDVVKVTVGRYHEMPLWNAYECGGVPLWDNPEMPGASPLVYLTLPLSATHTMWVWYIVHSAMGFIAMWLLARIEFRLSRIATFTAACLWAFGVGHITQYSGGHATLCNFYLFPGALLLWRRAGEHVDCAVGLGLLFAFIFMEGGAYPLVHTGLLLFCETVLRFLYRPNPLHVLRAGVIVSVVAFLCAAVRLLPVLDQVRRHKRELGIETDALKWDTFVAMFFSRSHGWTVPGQTYVWPEFASYFGILAMALCVIGIVVAGWEYLWFVALGILAFGLMMGHQSPTAPWALLKAHVFPFTSMRVPSRFRLYVAAFIAIFVGLAIDRLAKRIRQFGAGRATTEIVRMLTMALALLAAGDVMAVSSETVLSKYVSAGETKVAPSTRLFFEGPGTAQWIDQPRQNRARLGCADSWPFTEGAPLWIGDVPQARATDTDRATVEVANRTPNTFTIDVDVREPTRILVNTPYEVGWRTSVGTTADVQKQLAIDLPQGRHRVRVRYWPNGLSLGIVLTIVGLIGSISWLTRRQIKASIREWKERREEKADGSKSA